MSAAGSRQAPCAVRVSVWMGSALLLAATLSACEGRSTEGDVATEERALNAPAAVAIAREEDVRAFDAQFQSTYRAGLHAGVGIPVLSMYGHSAEVRRGVVAELRRERARVATIPEEFDALLSRGAAFAEFDEAMRALGLDPRQLEDVVAMQHAVYWAVANRERFPGERLQDLRAAVEDAPYWPQLAGADSTARQLFSERAALMTVLRSHEYARLLQAGDVAALERYGERVGAEFQARHGVSLRGAALNAF